MRFLKAVLLVLCSIFMMGITTFAGNINEHEQRVLDEVSTPVVYEGKEYVAKEEYVTRLAMYMNQDNVDLTAEQADLAIQKFIDNVATGIAEGYMEEVKSGSDKGGTGSGDDGKGTTETTDKNETDDESQDKEENNESSLNEGNDEIEETEENETIAETVEDSKGNVAEISEEESRIQESGLDAEEIARLQKERELVDSLLEKYSLADEEADVYAELEAIESSIEAEKDYSDAEPFQKGISLGTIAIIVVIVVAIVMVCIILSHRGRTYKRK